MNIASSDFLNFLQFMGKSTGVYLSDEVLEQVQAKANERYRGKVSAYIADVVESSLLQNKEPIPLPTPKSANALVELAKNFHPIVAQQIENYSNLFELDQNRILLDILDSLALQMTYNPNLPEFFVIRVEPTSYRFSPGNTSAIATRRKSSLKVAEDRPPKRTEARKEA